MKRVLFLLMTLSLILALPIIQAQTELTGLQEIASESPSINLEVFIFSDGSTFLQGQSDINPNLPVEYKDGKISGLTNQLTDKEKETWYFSLKTATVFDEINTKIVLPENAKLSGSINSNSLPIVYTQRNSLVIEISDFQKTLDISFSYEVPLEQKESDFTIFIYLGAILIAIAVVFLILRRKKAKSVKIEKPRTRIKKKAKPIKEKKETSLEAFKKKFETLKQTLNEREVKIVENLIELKGKAKQNQLQKYTGISKAAFSRHISSLEAKGLIEKKSLGRVNLIQAKIE